MAETWLLENCMRKSTKENNVGSFTIESFQSYLNKTFFPHWRIHAKDLEEDALPGGPSRSKGDIDPKDPTKRFLTVCEETARIWAKKLGARYLSATKSYFVDGHEREDVVYHRNKLWLPKEKKLELRQYLWVQKPQAEILAHMPNLHQAMANAGMVAPPVPSPKNATEQSSTSTHPAATSTITIEDVSIM